MTIMKLTLMTLLHTTPGLRYVARQIHPVWFFKMTLCSVTIANCFWPHAKKLVQPFRGVVGEHFDPKELRVRSRRHLLYLRLFKELEYAWSSWEKRQDWVSVEGEDYLINALAERKGVVLLSCHNFGFSKLVAPALALRDYHVHRAGGGKKDGRRVSRWGKNYKIAWKYLDHRGDYWHRLRSLKIIQSVLGYNHIMHVSPRAYEKGEEEMAVTVFNRKYYLDSRWFRLFERCGAPVLPCFAIANSGGEIKIVIHAPLPSAAKAMGTQFAKIQSDYLMKFPELGRLWKAVYLNRSQW
jgi:lauroyl/myristoyl acyltransferase